MFRFLVTAIFVLASLIPVLGTAGESWVRVPADQMPKRAALPAEAIDYGSFIWMPAQSRSAASVQSASGAVVIEDPFVIRIADETLDPAEVAPGARAASAGPDAADPDFHLVQFQGPIKPEWLSQLESLGFELIQPIQPFAYIVWGQAGDLPSRDSRAVSRVRWSGAYLSTFRGRPAEDKGPNTEVAFNAVVFGGASHDVAAELSKLGASVDKPLPFRGRLSTLRGTIQNGAIDQAASIPGLLTIQARPEDGGVRGEWAAQSITGGFAENPADPDIIWESGYLDWLSAAGVSGAGVVVGVVDSGIEEAHPDLANQFVECVSAGKSETSCTKNATIHGTQVAGLIAGDASSGESSPLSDPFLWGLGVAPGAQIIHQRFNSFGFFPASTMTTIFQETAMSGGLLVNNSWGHAGTPQGYDQLTMEVDMAARDARPDIPEIAPVLPVFAIMNGTGDDLGSACGPSSLGAPDEAKNILAVGATQLLGLYNDPMGHRTLPFSLSGTSGHGPACDGRLVPDLVAPGCDTMSPGGRAIGW